MEKINDNLVSSETERRLIKVKEYGINFTRKFSNGYFLNIDENGFIKTGNTLPTELTEKIMFLGDSFTECLCMDETDRFVSVIEYIYIYQYKKNVQFFNAGMSGSSIMSHIITLLAKIINLKIKKIIFVVNTIDNKISFFRNTYWNSNNRSSMFSNHLTNQRIGSNRQLDDYKKLLKLFNDMCKSLELECCYVLRPMRKKDDVRHLFNEIVKDFCINNQCMYIDLKSEFDDSCDNMFYDDIHLSAEGSRIFGNKLAEKLYELNWV